MWGFIFETSPVCVQIFAKFYIKSSFLFLLKIVNFKTNFRTNNLLNSKNPIEEIWFVGQFFLIFFSFTFSIFSSNYPKSLSRLASENLMFKSWKFVWLMGKFPLKCWWISPTFSKFGIWEFVCFKRCPLNSQFSYRTKRTSNIRSVKLL